MTSLQPGTKPSHSTQVTKQTVVHLSSERSIFLVLKLVLPSGLHMEPEPTRLPGSLNPFLSNNAPPSDVFSDELRKERDAQIAHIDMEILRLQKQREEMTLAYQQALSPVRRVPQEIWGRIFQQCFEGSYRGSYNHKSEPWIISHVCFTWRSIVTSMPALWSYIYCSPTSLNTVNPAGLLDLVLSRAGDKLNVVFRYTCNTFPTRQPRTPRCTPEEIEEGMTTLFRVIVRYCKLWRDASLHIASNHLDILHTIEGDIPNLRRISLFVGTSPTDSMGPTVTCFRVAPKLTSVHLTGSPWNAAEAFPWAQITDYDGFAGVHGPSNSNLFKVIIHTAKDLRTAKFRGKGITRVVPPVTLSNMTYLCFSDPNVLQSLSLPALTFLDHHPSPTDEDLPAQEIICIHLLPMMKRSDGCPKLARLELSNTPANDQLLTVLSKLPQLLELSLEYSDYSDGGVLSTQLNALMDRLSKCTLEGGQLVAHELLPELKAFSICIFTLRNDQPITVLGESFTALLASRCGFSATPALRSIEFTVHGTEATIWAPGVDLWKMFKAKGIQLSIFVPDENGRLKKVV